MAFTFTLKGITAVTAGTYRMQINGQDKVFLAVDYTKGDESTCVITPYIYVDSMAKDIQMGKNADGSALAISLSATGTRVIPFIDIPRSATYVDFVITSTGSTPTGTVVLSGISDVRMGG